MPETIPSLTFTLPESGFVPGDLACDDWSALEPLYDDLLDRAVHTAEQLLQWIADYDQLERAVRHYLTTTHVAHACHTDDPEIEARFLHTVREIEPKLAPIHDQLKRKAIHSPAIETLPGAESWRVTLRNWRSGIELFREANIALQTTCTELATGYDKLVGDMLIDLDGQTLTLQQLAPREADPDRETRERAWRLGAERRLKDRDPINEIYTKLVAHRQQIADNAGLANYRDYAMKDRKRFDYGTEECLAFHDAIKNVCVPLVKRLDEEKQAALGVDSLRPWDHPVDPAGAPLKPFSANDPDDLMQKSVAVFQATEPWMGQYLGRLKQGRNLDLVSRKGKRAGGFQASLTGYGEPFIFMNAAGTASDVRTMLHEAGHAFHYQLSVEHQPSVFQHGTGAEFAEVASMSMELATLDHLHAFYPNDDDRRRAQKQQLTTSVRMLAWIAVIDAFQHHVYTNPAAGIDAWTTEWLKITDAFGTRHGGVHIDWSGLEAERESYWQRQLHLFHIPFYYIEYGIAQLGALQLWVNAQQDKKQALNDYRHALSLGNTKTLPELFEAAGLRFDFTEQTLKPLIDAVQTELDALT